MANRRDHHFIEPQALYDAAPNLDTIYSCEGQGLWYAREPRQFFNVRRLAISGLFPESLGDLLLHGPKVEELEYYFERDNDFTIDNLAYMLAPVERTLKRFCFSYLPAHSGEMAFEPCPVWMEHPHSFNPPFNKTLQDFSNLEELIIDCHFLYRWSDREQVDGLVTLLPPSIRKLRILYLYKGIFTSLSRLAEMAPGYFPLLEDVTLSLAEWTDPIHKSNIEKKLRVGQLFQQSGIRFSVEEDLVGADSRTIIPGAMPGSKLIPAPRMMDENSRIWN
ncbi:uncharacterized protein F4812DRAFT_467663 [Daldinia caldariorum]|uniref:uncharacterized protein n=1 Tax=Daldinia caldariorum TaxID=326644 RepID=UPI002008B156|nr:uncharacterized protein F4812DRAFT_467663 [Daldinia caldariorum]KAI1471669.1 hypothetical protein F4812DRAFT_467663 [Daldinia caldariorum]